MDSRHRWIHGCNYPWSADGTVIYYGLDFGANAWGSHLGVSTRRPAIERDFASMAALGFTCVRWFVFGDGRAGIVYDDRGAPIGPDPHLFPDLDAALEIARGTGIGLDLVLLDQRWLFEGVRDTIADPTTGALLEASLPYGRAHVLHRREARDALFDRVLAPLVRRYGPAGDRRDLLAAILAYEFMNEPDVVVEEWEHDRSRHVARPLPFELLAEMIARFSELVHAWSTAKTTLGGARVSNLWAWDDPALGLDLLQVHSYPDERHPSRDVDPRLNPVGARALGVAHEVILGEFPARAAERHPPGASPPPTTLDEYLEFALATGYAGAWPWSFSGTDAYGGLPDEPLRRFAARHPELVNPRALMA